MSDDELRLKIMGVDPGFAHLGISMLTFVATKDDATTTLEDVHGINTEKQVWRGKADKGYGEKADDRRRLDEITKTFWELVIEYRPDVVSFEANPFVRKARITAQIAMAWGGCYTLVTRIFGASVLVFSPTDLKIAVCDNAKASKEDVSLWARTTFPEFDGWPEKKYMEHVADATAAGVAARDSHKFQLAVREWRRRTLSAEAVRDLVRNGAPTLKWW